MRKFCGALLAALLLVPVPALPCAVAPPPGEKIEIAQESALILWDKATGTEHFIRRATFRGAASHFGFLVPTPTVPELAEAPDEVFQRLDEAIQPEVHVRRRNHFDLTPMFLMAFLLRAPKSAAAPASVQVLAQKRVAGYDAVVLSADSPTALSAWLGQHGYPTRQELAAWLAPYVAARWKITAFKIAAAAGEAEVGTAAVRMSFRTERPFFPYREPADARADGTARSLRVFLVADERMQGALAPLQQDGAASAAGSWAGETEWAGALEQADLQRLLDGALPRERLPRGAWLTAMLDRSTARPGGEDLYFSPSAQREPVKPPPQEVLREKSIPVPVDIFGGMALGIWLVFRRQKPDDGTDG